jgi:hypothetical protein
LVPKQAKNELCPWEVASLGILKDRKPIIITGAKDEAMRSVVSIIQISSHVTGITLKPYDFISPKLLPLVPSPEAMFPIQIALD